MHIHHLKYMIEYLYNNSAELFHVKHLSLFKPRQTVYNRTGSENPCVT